VKDDVRRDEALLWPDYQIPGVEGRSPELVGQLKLKVAN
jgi:hypothetical protein